MCPDQIHFETEEFLGKQKFLTTIKFLTVKLLLSYYLVTIKFLTIIISTVNFAAIVPQSAVFQDFYRVYFPVLCVLVYGQQLVRYK